jgi:hypothetical protein
MSRLKSITVSLMVVSAFALPFLRQRQRQNSSVGEEE